MLLLVASLPPTLFFWRRTEEIAEEIAQIYKSPSLYTNDVFFSFQQSYNVKLL